MTQHLMNTLTNFDRYYFDGHRFGAREHLFMKTPLLNFWRCIRVILPTIIRNYLYLPLSDPCFWPLSCYISSLSVQGHITSAAAVRGKVTGRVLILWDTLLRFREFTFVPGFFYWGHYWDKPLTSCLPNVFAADPSTWSLGLSIITGVNTRFQWFRTDVGVNLLIAFATRACAVPTNHCSNMSLMSPVHLIEAVADG